MRKSTLNAGLKIIISGIVVIMAATFGHEWLARLFSLSYEAESRLIVRGLFWGGLLGGGGAVITIFGLFRAPGGRNGRVFPLLMLLAALVFLFFVLFYSTLEHPRSPRLRPGETITI